MSSHHRLFPLFFVVLIITHFIVGVSGDVYRRFHELSEARNVIVTNPNSTEYGDVVTVENFIRTYRHGTHNNEFILYNHDVIGGYAGPFPKGHPDKTLSLKAPEQASGTIRTWAMFDKKKFTVCDIDGIYDWGQLVLFTCPEPGLYQAYAIETNVTSIPRPTPWTCQGDNRHDNNCGLAWFTRFQKEIFRLVGGQDGRMEVFKVPGGATQDVITGRKERMLALEAWGRGQPYQYTDSSGATIDMYVPTVVSDPVRIKESYFCYYWLYYLREVGRDGYIDTELVPPGFLKSDKKKDWKASITYEILVWVAEPSAIGLHELIDGNVVVSEYSKIVTNRFSESGLFPCLRKAHSSIEVVSEFVFVNEINPDNKLLADTPHWKSTIKVHTDRLISTLTDVTFTVASRQNTASFHCFVGEIRVLLVLRNFEFVPQRMLGPEHVNLNLSNVYEGIKHELTFEKVNVYGHGIHYIGAKWSKKFQPASQRPDMVIMTNPCIVQEFALAVGGSLYVVQGLMRKGSQDAKKVVLPFFPNYRKNEEKVPKDQDFLRVFDVAFTPTHVAFMFSDGYVLLHTSSASIKGVAEITETMKYRPDQFVKRKWCPRSSSPKLHAMMLPIFGEKGNIIILQVYLTEGNVQMHLKPLSSSCLPENAGFAKKLAELNLVNETDIHYNDFAAVNRTNHKTGLREPKLAPRPPPPPPPAKNIYEEPTFLLDSSREFVNIGEDPHFPPQLLDPVGHVMEPDLKDYNQAKIYILEEADEQSNGGLSNLLKQNGFSLPSEITIADVQFTVAEKQFIFGIRFMASEISDHFPTEPPFKMMVSTMYVTNFPYLVKIRPTTKGGVAEMPDEKLETVVPFPGVIYLRTRPYKVAVAKSRDPLETKEHTESLRGSTQVDYVPRFHVLGTAIPTFVINLGDVLVYSSVEHRYAKPLHYFPWSVLKNATDHVSPSRYSTKPVVGFDKSTIQFAGENRTLFDVEITEQGLISVLWRKKQRHLVQDDEECLVTEDSDIQAVVMGSVIANEGLREVKPFFRNDNIFQLTTPEGEIIYGVFDVKPRAAFANCLDNTTFEETASDTEPCIEQPTQWLSKREVKVCAITEQGFDTACRDAAYLEYCTNTSSTVDPTHACVRKNSGCRDDTREDEEDFVPPRAINATNCDRNEQGGPTNSTFQVMSCMPKHAPREDLRSAAILGTSYQSYLQGSLESVRTMHPEASTDPEKLQWEAQEEPDICPFANFQVYHRQLDFAEVGYQLRVTAQVSYIGYTIPPEADLLVEYEKIMGVVVEISTSVEEIRDLTSIYKVVDFYFHMNDYLLQEQFDSDPAEKHHQRALKFDFDDIRAREEFNVFSITFRPSIINSRCKSQDFFRTIQFNVGCNTFSNIRLMSETTALKPVNWTESLNEATGYQWHRDYTNWNLTLPRVHIYYQQLKNRVFKCDNNPDYCDIPFFHLYRNEIYALSFKDYFFPKFEQLLSTSSRPVSGNVVIYDLLGSREFNWTVTKYRARCLNLGKKWYDKLLYGTRFIGGETFEHENVYYYFKDCFDERHNGGEEEKLHDLLTTPHYLFNRTNRNGLKFGRNRNQIFIFRAVVLNTYYNRFSYCRQLDTFFMVRIAGVPIPRQGLFLWQYVSILTIVAAGFVAWYFIFARFYTWTVRIPTRTHQHQA